MNALFLANLVQFCNSNTTDFVFCKYSGSGEIQDGVEISCKIPSVALYNPTVWDDSMTYSDAVMVTKYQIVMRNMFAKVMSYVEQWIIDNELSNSLDIIEVRPYFTGSEYTSDTVTVFVEMRVYMKQNVSSDSSVIEMDYSRFL